jgi:hypothetical protein
MTPTEFNASVAEVMSVERTEIATVDRALAKHGLRQLARGRYRPDISLREGVQLICAWAAAKSLTLAADDVQRLERCMPQVTTASDYEYTGHKNSRFPELFGREEFELEGVNFLDVTSMLANQLAAEKFPANRVWISLEKGGVPGIEYDADFKTQYLRFSCFPKTFSLKQKTGSKPEPAINVRVTTSINGAVLKWIHEVTEGV